MAGIRIGHYEGDSGASNSSFLNSGLPTPYIADGIIQPSVRALRVIRILSSCPPMEATKLASLIELPIGFQLLKKCRGNPVGGGLSDGGNSCTLKSMRNGITQEGESNECQNT